MVLALLNLTLALTQIITIAVFLLVSITKYCILVTKLSKMAPLLLKE